MSVVSAATTLQTEGQEVPARSRNATGEYAQLNEGDDWRQVQTVFERDIEQPGLSEFLFIDLTHGSE